MKVLIAASCVLLPVAAHCQSDSSAALINPAPVTYRPHSVLATVALGFIDGYRVNYPVPAGYSKSSTSGFAPLQAGVEHKIGHLGVGAIVGYDNFVANLTRRFQGNNGIFTRYINSNTRIFSIGANVFYHFRHLLPSQFDPFIGAALLLNNIRYSAVPQGDTTASRVDHMVTPVLKAGVRYRLSHSFTLYSDAGYDRHAAINIGCSIRFAKKIRIDAGGSVGVPGHNDDTSVAKADTTLLKSVTQIQGVPQPTAVGPESPVKESSPVSTTAAPDDKVIVVTAVPGQGELTLPIGTIQFQLGKTAISPASFPALDQLAALLHRNPSITILIDGYADTTGNDAINNRISLARAQGIKKYLVSKGVQPTRIIATGHGSRSPIASNRTRAGRAKNRRVALKLK